MPGMTERKRYMREAAVPYKNKNKKDGTVTNYKKKYRRP